MPKTKNVTSASGQKKCINASWKRPTLLLIHLAKDRECCKCIMSKTEIVANESCWRLWMLLMHHSKKKRLRMVLMHYTKGREYWYASYQRQRMLLMHHTKDKDYCKCIMPKTKNVANVSCQRLKMVLMHHAKNRPCCLCIVQK